MNAKVSLTLIVLNLLVAILLGRYVAFELEHRRNFDKEIPLLHKKVKLLDESIHTELLNIINGKSINYDALSKLNTERRHDAEQLKQALNKSLSHDPLLQRLLARYEEIRRHHEALISNVVSSRALSRNSRNYTFHLVNELSDELFQQAWFAESKLIQTLWIKVAHFYIDPSFRSDRQIRDELSYTIDKLYQNLPAKYNESIDALSQHLQTLVKTQSATAQSLFTITEIEEDTTLDDIFQRYELESTRLSDKTNVALTVFILSLATLVGLLIVAASQMIKKTGKLSEEKDSLTLKVEESHAFLHKTNKELKNEIEQRKVVEKELRDAAIFYDNCAQGVLICAADKSVISVNHAYTSITGISANKIMARIPPVFSDQFIGAEMLASIEHSLAQIGRWHGEVRTQNEDGNLTFKEATIIAVSNDGRLERYLIILTDIDARKQAEKVIYNQANYDELTQLPNRSLLKDRVSSIIKESRRNHKRFALLFIDVDNFKTINDNRGHTVGDEILKIIAQRLIETVREIDTVSRFGGDEFIIIVNDIADGKLLDDLLMRINNCMKEPVHVECDDESFYVSGSIGVAIYPNDAEELSLLISRADMAMYKAKAQGKNTYCLYNDKMNTEAQERMALEKKMRHALENNEFFLHYQPIINTQTETMTGVEALIRWQLEDGEFISPDKFIPVAEDNGLIIEIGEWVLRESCQQLARWSQRHHRPIRLNVNISAKQLLDAQFISRLQAVVEETQIDCKQLSLEITENLFLDDTDGNILALLQQVRQMGFSISLDDFGTGYSSLSYIKRFPLDYIKIDRSFIGDLIENPSDQSLVAAIIGMAKSLDKQVVAEGVETQAQLDWLKVYDCNSAQGYFISKPVPADKISEYFLD